MKPIEIKCLCGRAPAMYEGDPVVRCTCGRRWDYYIDAKAEPVAREVPFTIQPVLATDLDGTVRYSKAGRHFGPRHEDDVAIFPGVEEKLWEYRNKGFRIVGITNQGGVGAGVLTEVQVVGTIVATHAAFKKDPFHAIEVCYALPGGAAQPHHLPSLRRKPGYGMLVQAELHAFDAGIVIDWENSLMVGDRPEDKGCADAAGVAFAWAWDFFGRAKPALGD